MSATFCLSSFLSQLYFVNKPWCAIMTKHVEPWELPWLRQCLWECRVLSSLSWVWRSSSHHKGPHPFHIHGPFLQVHCLLGLLGALLSSFAPKLDWLVSCECCLAWLAWKIKAQTLHRDIGNQGAVFQASSKPGSRSRCFSYRDEVCRLLVLALKVLVWCLSVFFPCSLSASPAGSLFCNMFDSPHVYILPPIRLHWFKLSDNIFQGRIEY